MARQAGGDLIRVKREHQGMYVVTVIPGSTAEGGRARNLGATRSCLALDSGFVRLRPAGFGGRPGMTKRNGRHDAGRSISRSLGSSA